MIRGRVQKGVVVLDQPESLADGTEVSVQPVKSKNGRGKSKPKKPLTVGKELLKLSGIAKGLPRDASRNLDHYLYGHNKR